MYNYQTYSPIEHIPLYFLQTKVTRKSHIHLQTKYINPCVCDQFSLLLDYKFQRPGNWSFWSLQTRSSFFSFLNCHVLDIFQIQRLNANTQDEDVTFSSAGGHSSVPTVPGTCWCCWPSWSPSCCWWTAHTPAQQSATRQPIFSITQPTAALHTILHPVKSWHKPCTIYSARDIVCCSLFFILLKTTTCVRKRYCWPAIPTSLLFLWLNAKPHYMPCDASQRWEGERDGPCPALQQILRRWWRRWWPRRCTFCGRPGWSAHTPWGPAAQTITTPLNAWGRGSLSTVSSTYLL